MYLCGVYDYGTTATLVATAKTGYSFAGWSDGVTTAERTLTIDFTHDTTVTASFTVNQYTVTVESADTVMGSVSGTATVDYNTRTSISATANEHYHFVKWNDGVTSATRTVTVREDVTYTATFAPDMYTITVEVPIHDTVIEYVEVHDTLWLTEYIHDTVYIEVHDTVYIHDTIFVGVDDVEALDAKIYANNGQIVVEGADGNKVVLYDVTGRILATKVDEYAPLRFDIPVSGTYLVKIGNHAARRIVMIR